ncbi:hypothetical protein [Aureliella helgolandensis]|uniref:HEAT repeat protein n=1 Tax=Aureliella helgolandensis TaxID=2527968 RepID=A0A518G0B4_9BACT|nr:hypothetical protein [Aureliella helgolandensis]QDV21964.1 hypothetical protein Q31a_02430 [Aureliella helgolandensis]
MPLTDHSPLAIEQIRSLVNDPQEAGLRTLDLLACLNDSEMELRGWACDALEVIQQIPEEIVPELLLACSHKNAGISEYSCTLLARRANSCDAAQQAAIQQTLRTTLQTHSETAARQAAAAALGKLPTLDQESRSALQQATTSTDPRLSRLARTALDTTT